MNQQLSACPMPREDLPNVLPLEGEIDLHVSPNITASLNMMIEKKPSRLIVDLSRVSYIDSSGLAVLIEGMQRVQQYGGKFALAGLQESVRIVFEIARLDQVFQIFPTVDAARAAT
jgi:anti-sigma B factor antagonist